MSSDDYFTKVARRQAGHRHQSGGSLTATIAVVMIMLVLSPVVIGAALLFAPIVGVLVIGGYCAIAVLAIRTANAPSSPPGSGHDLEAILARSAGTIPPARDLAHIPPPAPETRNQIAADSTPPAAVRAERADPTSPDLRGAATRGPVRDLSQLPPPVGLDPDER